MPLRTELDEPLAEAVSALKEAFPDGVATADYHALLAVLYEHFSDRNLALVVAQLTQRDPALVLNDIHQAVTLAKPSQQAIASLNTHLHRHGIAKLLADD
ncbi:DUF3349 domain-containing protein [Pseudomonas piscis]|uniref:DUF3349 domain-containing protein n=1 Tax=Pseudomonas piscis TaxID=2614538 RepID=UPI0003B5B5CD|nr:DUF3349 domain-containing protein [Pseudomonas piscis]ERO64980.1 hypothetical protein P308_21480 [Pseudomonas piscis]